MMSQILASTNNNLPQNNLGIKEPSGDAEITLRTSFLLGFPIWRSYIYNSYINTAPPTSFLAPFLGRKKISARGVSRFQSVTLLLFCFILFLLASFYQKYKKINLPQSRCIKTPRSVNKT
jgi:hypothetical protein